MRSFIATTLAFAGAAVAAATEPTVSKLFQIRALNNQGLEGWSVVNAHQAAELNAIQIQRPAAFQPDSAYLNGTTLSFELKGVQFPYGMVIPTVPEGGVVEVTSVMGLQTEGFSLTKDNLVAFNNNANSWYACIVDENFTLFYGVNPIPSKLPSSNCQAVILSAAFV
ncbi:hypothetical protein GGR50DRAFT_369836 [Xylaria sp. CBS 124048]|nr:hypothetical protein GGR50DRAFT_369836 [Xylaria sp. CBS 124048]